MTPRCSMLSSSFFTASGRSTAADLLVYSAAWTLSVSASSNRCLLDQLLVPKLSFVYQYHPWVILDQLSIALVLPSLFDEVL